MARPFIVGYIETNEKSLECNFYKTMGVNAYGAALASAFTGQFYAAGGAALIGGAAELAYSLSGCNDPPPPVPEGECWARPDGQPGLLYFWEDRDCGENTAVWASTSFLAIEILEVFAYDPNPNTGHISSNVTFIDQNGATQKRLFDHRCAEAKYKIDGCVPQDPVLPPHSPGEPIAEPIKVEDPDTDCEWTIQATDAYVDNGGKWHTYYTVTANNDACGGPFAYWSSGDGPDWVPPPQGPDGGPPPGPPPPPQYQPEPEPCPDPCPPAPSPCPPIPPPHQLGAATYQITGVCENVADGQPQPSYQYPVGGGRFEDVLSGKLDAIAQMLQRHLSLKTPTCASTKPDLWLHWRSIRFESDEYTPNGNRRLSKLFRYRGSSPGDVGRVADHWKDFRWVTGSTVVIHKGSSVGTPQVWARDADEGKRVIRHAFLEAGADADSVGEWVVTGPSGSRKGVSLEVGLLCVDGCWSATARPGSAGWPEAAVASPDPYGSG